MQVGKWLDRQLQLSGFAAHTFAEPIFFRSVVDSSSLSLQLRSGLVRTRTLLALSPLTLECCTVVAHRFRQRPAGGRHDTRALHPA